MAYLRFAPYVAIAALLIGLLWYRAEAIEAEADLDAAETRIETLNEANQTLETSLALVTAQQVSNDLIAEDVAEELAGNAERAQAVEDAIRKAAQNDPEVRDLLDTALPSSVRDGLRAGSIDAPAP